MRTCEGVKHLTLKFVKIKMKEQECIIHTKHYSWVLAYGVIQYHRQTASTTDH